MALVLICWSLWHTLGSEAFCPPVAEDQINTILVYRIQGDSREETKSVGQPEDIAMILRALRETRLYRNTHQDTIYGGTTFLLQFHCKDGSVVEASFVQSGVSGGGYYQDSYTQGVLSWINMESLWDSLEDTGDSFHDPIQ